MTTRKKPTDHKESLPTSYEAAVQELEQLVVRIESGQLPLDQLLQGYKRGAALLEHCQKQLAAVEHQIKILEHGVAKTWSEE